MKILYTHLYNSKFRIGGAEKVLLDIARSMQESHGASALCLVNPGDFDQLLDQAKIQKRPIAWSKFKTPQTVSAIRAAIQDFQPDVIHSHHRYTTFLCDLFFKRKVPLIHTEHVLRQDKKIFFRYGHYTTAVHESVRQNLIHYFNVPEPNVLTIPNAVSVAPPDPAVLSELRLRYPNTIKTALVIGRFEEQKGHVYLLEAVKEMSAQARQKLRILLAGDGSLEPIFREQAEKSKALGQVMHFLGHTPHVAEYLALCDFLILPSLWEGMPLSVLEAYDAGKPVVATDIPGTRETVKSGKTGLLVPAKDPIALARALETMVQDPGKCQGMAEQAKLWSKQEYSFSVMIQRYNDLYHRVAGEFRA